MKSKQRCGEPTFQEERRFISAAAEAIRTDFPNAERLGCPEPADLRAIAQRHLSVLDIEDVVDHIATCAPCFLEYTHHRRRHLLKRRGGLALICVVGVLVIGAAWRFRPLNREPERQPIVRQEFDPVLTATLDFRNRTIERSGQAQRRPEPETPHLKRARLKLTLLLPIGTEEGAYAVQFWTRAHQPVVNETGTLVWDGSAETLVTAIDLRKLEPGRYTLAIRASNASWYTFAVFVD